MIFEYGEGIAVEDQEDISIEGEEDILVVVTASLELTEALPCLGHDRGRWRRHYLESSLKAIIELW